MKLLSFLRRLFPGRPSPVPAPPITRPDVFDKYVELLLLENQRLTQLQQATEQALTNTKALHEARNENATLRRILSGDYTVGQPPHFIN